MSDQYTPSMDEVLDAWVDARCTNDSRAHLVERAIQDGQRALAAFKRDTEIALLERLADEMPVGFNQETLNLERRQVKRWIRSQANELRDERRSLMEAATYAFNSGDFEKPTWQDDPVGRDAAVRWHMRGFEAGIEYARRPASPLEG